MRPPPHGVGATAVSLCAALAFGGAWAECLSGAVPPADRAYLREGGVDMPLRFWEHDWASAQMATQVAKILVEERMGYRTWSAAKPSKSGSRAGFYALAGCQEPENFHKDPKCVEAPTFRYHVCLEVWGGHTIASAGARLAAWPHVLPEDAGSVGYDGLEGLYVFNSTWHAAWVSEGLPLEFYRSFDANWRTPWRHFASYTAIDRSLLLACGDTRMVNSGEVADYLKHTGDADGVSGTSPGGLTARCWEGHWWLSPACRAAPATCIPTLTGGNGWFFDDIMQKATAHSMPIALAVAKSSADRLTLSQQHTSLPYWWQPDATFIDLAPRQVIFPPTDLRERSRGNLASAATVDPINKILYRGLGTAAPVLREFFLRLSLSMKDMESMLLQSSANKSLSYEEVACSWVRQNQQTWKDWIPGVTDCVAGQGLRSGNGTFAKSRQGAVCAWCLPGSKSTEFRDSSGLTYVCEQCPPGTSQSMPGQTVCLECGRGLYAASPGMLQCARCGVGTYQSGTAGRDCLPCPPPTTTEFPAAVAAAECVCPVDTYQPAVHAALCLPCPEGMSCARPNCSEAAIAPQGAEGVHPFPMAAPGHMTLLTDPLQPYRCLPAGKCPGGPPGTCGAHRDASFPACGVCAEGAYDAADGECHRCAGVAPLFVVGAAAAAVAALAALAFMASSGRLQQRHSSATCAAVIGLTATSVQSLGVFSNLSVRWPEPFRSALNVMAMMALDTRGIQLQCMVRSSPAMNYLGRQLLLPSSVIVLAVAMLLKKRFYDPTVEYGVELLNALGTLFMILFISMVVICAVPFICYRHPGSAGYSMLESQSVICYTSGRHQAMMAISIVSFVLFVVPFIALVAYGTLRYPRFARQGKGNRGRGLRTFRFLFVRFRPPAYFYAILLLARGVLVCLVPIVFRDNSVTQVLVMVCLFQGFSCVQQFLKPWRSRIANVADAGTSAMMVLVLVCAAFSAEEDDVASTVGVMAILIVLALLLLLCVALGRGIYLLLVPAPYFHRFVCHHKRDAAAQARFLQLTLVERTGQSCFLDSDHLTDLSELLDVVRCRLGRLLVLLTGETLKRPWCAGEITTAFMTHQRVTLLVTPSFLAPTPRQLLQVGSYLDLDGVNLLEMGISEELISRAYEWLLLDGGPPRVKLEVERGRRAAVGRGRLLGLADGVLGSPAGDWGLEAPKPEMLVFSSDPADDEATAACGILVGKLRADVMDLTSAGCCMLADVGSLGDDQLRDAVEEAHAVVVVLTAGTLQSEQQLRVITTAADASVLLIPVSTPSFKFPSDRSFVDVLPSFMPNRRDDLRNALQALFRLISVFLATNASNLVIDAQVREVLARLPDKQAVDKVRSNKDSVRSRERSIASGGSMIAPSFERGDGVLTVHEDTFGL